MKRICVFCGSRSGGRPQYAEAAKQLADLLARSSIGLVYGGASVGVMGQMATAALEAGGEVIGVIPKGLVEKEVAFAELADLRVVESIETRIAVMADIADGFVVLPGGLGTIDEFVEVLTRAKLGEHQKPIGLLNVCQFFNGLIGFLDHMVEEQFVGLDIRTMILVDESPGGLLEKLERYQAPDVKCERR